MSWQLTNHITWQDKGMFHPWNGCLKLLLLLLCCVVLCCHGFHSPLVPCSACSNVALPAQKPKSKSLWGDVIFISLLPSWGSVVCVHECVNVWMCDTDTCISKIIEFCVPPFFIDFFCYLNFLHMPCYSLLSQAFHSTFSYFVVLNMLLSMLYVFVWSFVPWPCFDSNQTAPTINQTGHFFFFNPTSSR